MRTWAVTIGISALVCLRCSPFGTESTTPPNDAGASSISSSSSSSSGDAATPPPGIETRDIQGTPCIASSPTVFGMDHDITDAENDDYVPPATVDAYSYLVVTDDFAQCAHVYVKGPIQGQTDSIHFGVYSNDPDGPKPGTLVTRGLLTNVKEGWNAAPLEKAVRAPKGMRLWIGIVPQSYNIRIITDKDDDCANTQSGGLHPIAVETPSLPAIWQGEDSSRVETNRCNARFFVSP